MRPFERKGDHNGGKSRRTWRSRLLRLPKEEDLWWKPYGSKEKAYDLDWGDAIAEYTRRELPNILAGEWKGKDWPWTDSPWMKRVERYW